MRPSFHRLFLVFCLCELSRGHQGEGFLSVLFSIVNYSKKELSIRQVLFRRFLHLLLIEGLVLGLNYMTGALSDFLFFFVLAVSVAVVFILVYVFVWIGERASAMRFNEQLKIYQSRQG